MIRDQRVDRRSFLKTTASLACAPAVSPCIATCAVAAFEPHVMTVTGALPADQLGTMLPHEHVLVDFIGAAKVSPDRYDADDVFNVMLPYLKQARQLGCGAMAECTPAYLGRDPKLLERLSQASGVKLLTNTGYYGAGQGKYLPEHVLQESPDELAGRWIREWNAGIRDTGVRPGFIKIGVDAGPLTEVNRKLVQAAARCHLATGLSIAAHTGDGTAALEQVDVLLAEGAPLGAWIWVHAQSEKDGELHREMARRGGWVEFDGLGPASVAQHVRLVENLRQPDLLERVLISHDAGWYSVGEAQGGEVRAYDTLFAAFLPALRRAGFDEREIRQITVQNPADAFAVRPVVDNVDADRAALDGVEAAFSSSGEQNGEHVLQP